MSSSPPPTDGLPRPTQVNKGKSHPMSTRSGVTPSPETVDAEGNWPTPAEAAQVKCVKHSKNVGGMMSPKRSPSKQNSQRSPNKTPQQCRTAQEPKSAVSEERRRQKMNLFESRFGQAKEFMDEIHGSTPSIASLTVDGFLDEFCQPKGVLLRIFVERILGRMNVNLKSTTNAMQNAIYFMNACSELGVSVDILLNTTDILHRRIAPIVNNILAIRDIYEARNRDLDTFTEEESNMHTMNPMMCALNQEKMSEVATIEPPALVPITPKALRPAQCPASQPISESVTLSESIETYPTQTESETDAVVEVDTKVTEESGDILRELEAKALTRKEEFAQQAKAYEEKKEAMEKELAEKKILIAKQAENTRECLKTINSNVVKSSIANELSSCVSDVGGLMATLMKGVQAHVKQTKDTEESLSKEIAQRKKLFNQIQEMNGNIRVFVRVRPSKSSDAKKAASLTKDGDLQLDMEAGLTDEQRNAAKSTGRTIPPKVAEFDHVFGESSTQEAVFAKACPLVTSVMDGWHASILAYGQTGSGKTYTMEGVPGQEGVNVRALQELFRIKEEKEASGIESVEVSLTMVEIYNETVRDLLGEKSSTDSCDIRQRPAIEGGGVFLPTATVVQVNSIDDVDQAMQKGKANRSTGSTKANQHSSRSHSVLMVDVKVKNIATGLITSGRLSLVDLAGSERIAKTGASGATLKEAQAINTSLSALGNVISSLKAKQQNDKAAGHIPYRNSKLTFLLQDSLGADNKTLVVVQVSPDADDVQETNCSVTFGARARNVELGVGSSAPKSKGGVAKQAQVEAMVSKANKEKNQLEAKLATSEAKCKSLEKALEEQKQSASGALAAVKSSKLEIAQAAESTKKIKAQSENANKKTEYQLRIAMDKLEKMEKENQQMSEERKKSESKMKKMEEELVALRACVKKESSKPKKSTSTASVSVSTPAPVESAPIVAAVEPVAALSVVEESVSFAQIAASPPKSKENRVEIAASTSIMSGTQSAPKSAKKTAKKVCFISPPPRSPLAPRTENHLQSQESQGKFRTTPHKEKPSLQEATTSSMQSILSKSSSLTSTSTHGTHGATRVSISDAKKGGALSKGAQRISFSSSSSGGGGSRRSSVSTSGSRWH